MLFLQEKLKCVGLIWYLDGRKDYFIRSTGISIEDKFLFHSWGILWGRGGIFE